LFVLGFGSGSQSAFQPVSNVIRRPGSSAAGVGRNGSVSPRPASWVNCYFGLEMPRPCLLHNTKICMIASSLFLLFDFRFQKKKNICFPFIFGMLPSTVIRMRGSVPTHRLSLIFFFFLQKNIFLSPLKTISSLVIVWNLKFFGFEKMSHSIPILFTVSSISCLFFDWTLYFQFYRHDSAAPKLCGTIDGRCCGCRNSHTNDWIA
jgi:hypothetical protein